MSRKPAIVLYNPRAVFYTMPLSLVAVGSSVDRQRFDVRIVDGRFEADPAAALVEATADAVALGLTVLTGDPIHDALEVGRAVKARRPDLPIVWGGWHASLFPEETLAEPTIDITVQGQGEVTFRELVERLAAGEPLHGLAGVTFRDGGRIVRNPPRALVPMDGVAAYDYDLLPVERYFTLKQQRQLDYISSIGCRFRCAFCADPFVYQRGWSGLSPARMGEEIEALWRRYRFTELAFQDETFFTSRDRVAAVAREFRARALDFTWTATLRADQAVRLGDEALGSAVASGLRRVLVGVESGSQEMLDWMAKDITIEQVLETAALCVRHGVGAIFPFIVGFPGESEASVAHTMRLMKRLRALSPGFETPLFYFKPYPGSRITDEMVRQGYALPSSLEEWARFDFIGSAGPWVTPEMFARMERFKFYNRFAWGPETWKRWPLQKLARWRCERDFYRWPVEQALVERLHPSPRLS